MIPALALAASGSEADRRRRRALLRAHHPDLGGDPDVFIQVVQGLDREAVAEWPAEVRFARRRRWWVPEPRLPFRRQRPRRVV